jgi:hypothetical protein
MQLLNQYALGPCLIIIVLLCIPVLRKFKNWFRLLFDYFKTFVKPLNSIILLSLNSNFFNVKSASRPNIKYFFSSPIRFILPNSFRICSSLEKNSSIVGSLEPI